MALLVAMVMVYLIKIKVNTNEGVIPLLLPIIVYWLCYGGVIFYLEKKTMQRFLTLIKNKNV